MSMVDTPREGALAASAAAVTVDVGGGDGVAAAPFRRQRSLWGDVWRRLLRNKLAMFGFYSIVVLLFLTVAADWIMPYDYDFQNFGNIGEPPSWEFPLGTDLVGRDMLSRMIYGARVSMAVAVISQIVILLIAVPIGSIAGYFGGWVDNLLMRVVDIFYAIPQLLLAILT